MSNKNISPEMIHKTNTVGYVQQVFLEHSIYQMVLSKLVDSAVISEMDLQAIYEECTADHMQLVTSHITNAAKLNTKEAN